MDRHLRVADGWSIAPLVDLTGALPYIAADYTETRGAITSNEPSYIAALYPPFEASLAVIAGRSVIEIAADGGPSVHSYRPAKPDAAGPDVPRRATFADLGAGKTGLWLTSESTDGGDGLFLIDRSWALTTIDATNNTNALGLDPAGRYDGVGTPALYVSTELDQLGRWTAAAAPKVINAPGEVDDLAIKDGALFITIVGDATVELDRIEPAPSHLVANLSTATSLVLAEGSTDAALFAIRNGSELVTLGPSDGVATSVAWTDDLDWVWHAVSAPRAGHRRAGQLIVLESNRGLDHDRLLLVTPP
jgi:hypothetical protein